MIDLAKVDECLVRIFGSIELGRLVMMKSGRVLTGRPMGGSILILFFEKTHEFLFSIIKNNGKSE